MLSKISSGRAHCHRPYGGRAQHFDKNSHLAERGLFPQPDSIFEGRVLYQKCIGGEDSLISFFEIGSASRVTLVIFPVVFGLLAWLAAGSWPVVIAAAVIGLAIELIMNFRSAGK